MVSEVKKNCELRMHKALENYKSNLAKIRTGRPHAGLLEHIVVDCYGSVMPISQVANISVSDAKTITVTVWDSKMIGAVEKAIRDSDLGLNPVVNGTVIRVPMPVLTEERRKELIKVVKSEGENAKIVIRNVRRDANNELKAKLKDKLISEDDEKRGQDEVQKMTDKFIIDVDKLTVDKEKELLTV
ncbi:MAG: ribosome recycling factor [Pseudomonadota bacterium]|nr:ribosome recycling factor [Pseudomonadota bacterium]